MNTCLYNSPIGILKISENNGEITHLCLHQEENVPIYTGSLPQKQPGRQDQHNQQDDQSIQRLHDHERHSLGQKSELLIVACRQLEEYFQGKRKNYDLPISYAGTPFQERVWRELQNIPYGETRSYEDIAVQIGSPKAVRAVGQANNRNPILLIIPCHRVIHKNGDISGFACGIEAKKYLLDLEKDYFSQNNFFK